MADGFLKGKTALVTGAARNLGRGFAQMLARQGGNVMVHYHGQKARSDAEKTAALVREAGAEAELVAADLSDTAQISSMFDQTLARFGRLDTLLNTAGMIIKKPFMEITEEDYNTIFAVNAKSVFFCMQEAARRMHDGGRIVNVGTSILAMNTADSSIYARSKAPLEHFTRALAKELSERSIAVNMIAPGALDTSFFYPAETPESIQMIKQWTGGLGNVDDVVPLVEFLVSPGSRWLTGQTIFINGGVAGR
jgi:NAD(P)-dependent dehydrogenase (short-subunit alcohol dehydrogenase family)